jgi:hypothetical protein
MPSFQPVLVSSLDDRSQQYAELTGDRLEFIVVGVVAKT